MARHHPHRARSTPRGRGYILIEALIGSALVATAMIGVIDQVAGARAASIAQRRETAANQIVTASLETARDYWSYDALGAGAGANETVIVHRGPGTYTRNVAITGHTEAVSLTGSPMNVDYLLMQVTVTYTVDGVLHTVSGATRAYAEWGQQHVYF